MKSVLLIGQSNMAGRGFLNEATPIYNENIFMLRNGRWQMMAEPIHFDRSVSGVGPAASFAQAWCNANKNEVLCFLNKTRTENKFVFYNKPLKVLLQ